MNTETEVYHHETETKRLMTNVKTVDNFLKHEKGLSNPKIHGCNNYSVSNSSEGSSLTGKILKAANINTESISKGEYADKNK